MSGMWIQIRYEPLSVGSDDLPKPRVGITGPKPTASVDVILYPHTCGTNLLTLVVIGVSDSRIPMPAAELPSS